MPLRLFILPNSSLAFLKVTFLSFRRRSLFYSFVCFRVSTRGSVCVIDRVCVHVCVCDWVCAKVCVIVFLRVHAHVPLRLRTIWSSWLSTEKIVRPYVLLFPPKNPDLWKAVYKDYPSHVISLGAKICARGGGGAHYSGVAETNNFLICLMLIGRCSSPEPWALTDCFGDNRDHFGK